MATQIVMDHNGDSRYNFDPKDASALLQAEERFKGLTGGSSLSELLARDRCTAASSSGARRSRASLQSTPAASLCGLPQDTLYSQEHFGELTDVNGRHVIICDPQKVASSRMRHTRCSRALKKTCSFGRGQRRDPGTATRDWRRPERS
jgi:hypothetical protein